ncbi:MAG: response regulator [Bacillota bacterium]
MNIVIVDDEPKIARGLLKLISAREEYKAAGIFCDAAEALAFIERNPVDAVITDIRMPGISGLELIRRIRAVKAGVPIIILSGYGDFAYAQKAIEMGVIRYLLKPTVPTELIGALEAIRAELACVPEKETEQSAKIRNLLVRKAVEYIEKNYSGTVTLRKMAEALYVSPNYLCELFKRHTGRNIKEYLADYRLHLAKTYLGQVACKVSDVSKLVGYTDAKYFSTAFKKKYGMTPLEYRNQICPGDSEDA